MKTLLFIFSLVISAGLLMNPPQARAEHLTGEGRAWAKGVKRARDGGHLQLNRLDPSTNLDVVAHARIVAIAEDQAGGWADTILEGDFVAQGDVAVEKIEAVRKDDQTVTATGEFVGYRVTYSARAYDVSECNASKNLSQCRAGRIVESSFIDPALASWVRDHKAYAEFVEN